MLKIVPGACHALLGVDQTRQIERRLQSLLPPHTLMQRAGLATARLAQAIAPHAQRVWIACGPGNNGGDGLQAALHLHRWGKQTTITWLGTPDSVPTDTAATYRSVIDAGIAIAAEPMGKFDLCIDALLGIGTQLREPQNRMAEWIMHLNSTSSPVLSVDVPSGLDANTGTAAELHVKASHTLSLLTLKPGLFTAQGRDCAGTVWLDTLDADMGYAQVPSPFARLLSAPVTPARPHSSHKGTFGDVAVIGGAPGMTGAALLAASAALHAGAGRVFVSLLDAGRMSVNVHQPELMFRPVDALNLAAMTLVCGCGGGQVVHTVLPKVLSASPSVVIDADAINAIAMDTQLQATLTARSASQAVTVLTPHPLEAARLLGVSVIEIQHDRLAAARAMSDRFACTVVLKGSGSIVAAPGQISMINLTGNGRLATAGTGDVLAGMIGARLASGLNAFDAACYAVYQHGQLADAWPDSRSLSACQLALQRW